MFTLFNYVYSNHTQNSLLQVAAGTGSGSVTFDETFASVFKIIIHIQISMAH